MLDVKMSRNVPLTLGRSVLLVVDVQNFCCDLQGGDFINKNKSELEAYQYFFNRLSTIVLPNIKRLQTTFRQNEIEVLFTVVENLTKDGRDRGLDYKISGFNVPKGSPDAKVLDAIKPAVDEIVIPKTSSSVFNSTNIDYVLRNLNCSHLVICGVLTDQCVESAVRDACDLNYLVTLVTDACGTHTQERHDNSLKAINGYCRQCSTQDLIEEVEKLK
jgi:ureidoacrylate peracid hydrolase